jgi:hypothetical protein
MLCFVFLLTGCSGAPEPGARFDDESQAEVGCLKHQSEVPGARYTDDEMKRTDEVLPMLRYYTANGKKSFCDGKKATEVDKAWAELYVQLGADKGNVANLLA